MKKKRLFYHRRNKSKKRAYNELETSEEKIPIILNQLRLKIQKMKIQFYP